MLEQFHEKSQVAAQMEAAIASSGYAADKPPRPKKKIDLIPRVRSSGGRYRTPAPASEKEKLKKMRSVDEDPIEGARNRSGRGADMWAGKGPPRSISFPAAPTDGEMMIRPTLSTASSLSWHTFKENKECPFLDNGEVTEAEKAAAIQAVAEQAVKVAGAAEKEGEEMDNAIIVWTGEPPTFDENEDGIKCAPSTKSIERNRSIKSIGRNRSIKSIGRNRSTKSTKSTKTEERNDEDDVERVPKVDNEEGEEHPDNEAEEKQDDFASENLVIMAPAPSSVKAPISPKEEDVIKEEDEEEEEEPDEVSEEAPAEEIKETKVRGGAEFANIDVVEASNATENCRSKKETSRVAFGKISTASRMLKRRTRLSNLRKKKNAAKSTKTPPSLPTVEEEPDATDAEQDMTDVKRNAPKSILKASSINGEIKKRGLGLRRRVRMLGRYRQSKRTAESKKRTTVRMQEDSAATLASNTDSNIVVNIVVNGEEAVQESASPAEPSTPVKNKSPDDKPATSLANIIITPTKVTADKGNAENPADTPTTTVTNASTLETLSPTHHRDYDMSTPDKGIELSSGLAPENEFSANDGTALQFLPPAMPGSILTEKANPEEAEALAAFLNDKPDPPGSNASWDEGSPDPEASTKEGGEEKAIAEEDDDEEESVPKDMDLFQIKSSYKLREELDNLKETVQQKEDLAKDTCTVTTERSREVSEANTDDPSVHILFPDDDQGVLIGTSNDVLVEVSSVTHGDTGAEDIEVIKCMGLDDIGRDILRASSHIRDIQDRHEDEDEDDTNENDEEDAKARGEAGEDAEGGSEEQKHVAGDLSAKQLSKSTKLSDKTGKQSMKTEKTEKSARTSRSMWTSKTDKTDKTNKTMTSLNSRRRLRRERFRAAASAMKMVGAGNHGDNPRSKSQEPDGGRSRSKSRARSKSIKRRLSRKDRQNSVPEKDEQELHAMPKKRDKAVQPDIPSDITVRSERHGLSREAKKAVKASDASYGSHPIEELEPVIITPVSTPVLGKNQNKYGLSAEAQAALLGDEEAIEVGRANATGLSPKARHILAQESEAESDLEEIEVSFGLRGRAESKMGGVGSVRGRASQNKIVVSKRQKNRQQARNIRRSESSYDSYDEGSYESQDEDSDEYESDSYESESYDDCSYDEYSDEYSSVSSRTGRESSGEFTPFGIPKDEIIEDLMDAFEDTTAHFSQMMEGLGIGGARETGTDYACKVPETACGKSGAGKRRAKARAARKAAAERVTVDKRSSPRRKGEKGTRGAKNGRSSRIDGSGRRYPDSSTRSREKQNQREHGSGRNSGTRRDGAERENGRRTRIERKSKRSSSSRGRRMEV